MPSANEYNPVRLEFAESRLKLFYKYSEAVIIGRNCSIDHETVEIGRGTVIEDNVVIIGPVIIGMDCHIKSGTVIGSKGFSFGFREDLTPIPIVHTGGVVIGHDVEIGSLNTVCRGTVADTVLEDYVKTDDNIHIAHNCHIGDRTCIAAGVMFGGSVKVGSKCWFGPNATIMNGLTIAKYTLAGTAANVIKDTEYGDVVVGNPGRVLRKRSEDIYLEKDIGPFCACLEPECKLCTEAKERIGKWLDTVTLIKNGFVLKDE